MFLLENKIFLYALLLIPAFIAAFIFMLKMRNKKLNQFGETKVIKQLMPDVSIIRKIFKFILLLLALGALITAIANPQLGNKLEKVKKEGVDIMIALDISKSMLSEDLKPNRLERAKAAITKFIEKLENDRLGLIVFAGKPYVQLPITNDYAAAKMFVETINTNLAPVPGTAIGAAIDKALESFQDDNIKNKLIILVTDGENHEDDALEAAKNAASKNVIIHTIGIGSPDGVPIPVYENNVMRGYKKTKDGTTVISKLNEMLLQQIATSCNGIYVRASGADIGFRRIFSEIEKMQKKEFEGNIYADYETKFYYLAGFALLLLIIDFFLSERKSKILARMNLFKENKNTSTL